MYPRLIAYTDQLPSGRLICYEIGRGEFTIGERPFRGTENQARAAFERIVEEETDKAEAS